MVEKLSTAPDFVTSPELEEGIKNGKITTQTIDKENLYYYEQAARATGFEVKVIAEEDQYYVTEKTIAPRRRKANVQDQDKKAPEITAVISQFPVGKNCVAILLKRPSGVTDDRLFHLARQKIQPPS